MEKEAQIFMNEHGIKICYECDGVLFKREENANARKVKSGKEIVTHELSAGVRVTEQKTE
jgi:hypothetical protein